MAYDWALYIAMLDYIIPCIKTEQSKLGQLGRCLATSLSFKGAVHGISSKHLDIQSYTYYTGYTVIYLLYRLYTYYTGYTVIYLLYWLYSYIFIILVIQLYIYYTGYTVIYLLYWLYGYIFIILVI